MNAYDFKTALYFPFHVMLVGGGLLILGLSMLTLGMFIGGPIVLLIGLIILSTHYRCRVDFGNKMYQDYIWILGMRSGKKHAFETIDYIFIKESRETQTIGLRAANTTIQKTVYDAYLRFSETDKIHLITKNNKKELIAKLRPIAENLKTEIIDYTSGEPVIV